MKKRIVYLASPYASHEPTEIEKRVQAIKKVTEQVIREVPSIVPFSPIAYTHQFAHIKEIDWLERIDYPILRICNAMIIVQMQGWASSEGILQEKRFCQQNQIPVFYATPDEVVKRCWEIANKPMHLRTIAVR